MTLLLSTDALPDAPLEALAVACGRRALAGLEVALDARQAHGLHAAICAVNEQNAVPCLPDGAPEVSWLLIGADVSAIRSTLVLSAARRMHAGVLIRTSIPNPPRGRELALLHDSNVETMSGAVQWARNAGTATAWDVHPEAVDRRHLDAFLDEAMETLVHVRLRGSGPEADDPVNLAVGDILAGLALRGFGGTVSLLPSSEEKLPAWREWLFEKRGWGCGTAAAKQAKREARLAAISDHTHHDHSTS
jgi:hypothetical protein